MPAVSKADPKLAEDIIEYVNVRASMHTSAWVFPSQDKTSNQFVLEISATDRKPAIILTDGQVLALLRQVADSQDKSIDDILREAAG
jgi:hypothetical protein